MYPDILEAIIDASKVVPVVGILQPPPSPTKFFLRQDYPNPFNPQTTISHSLPWARALILQLYDVVGREVAMLAHNEKVPPGLHEVSFDAENLPSGVYFYRLWAGNFVETRKMAHIK